MLKTKIFFVFLVVTIVAVELSAQNNAQGSAWLDAFGSPSGAIVYPQYSWNTHTKIGSFGGYGFVETAPREPFFTNHLIVYTPTKLPQFSIHTETGGVPAKGLGFFQIAPRLNLHEVIPGVKKPLAYLFVAALPRFIGIRPNNLLVAGGTKQLAVTSAIKISAEGYRRFFPGHRPDYGEYWFLVHPNATKHINFGAFLLHHGSRKTLAFGIRISS